MIILFAQGPSLQRRTKVPCSCQSTADSCWLPSRRRLPLWEAPGVPALPGSIGQRIPHPLAGPRAHQAPAGPKAVPAHCPVGWRMENGEWTSETIRAMLAQSAKGCEIEQAPSWASLQWPSLQWSRLLPTLHVQFQLFRFLCFKFLIPQTSWPFPCNLAFIYMHGHTQAHVVPALLLLHESHMRTAQVF